MCVREAGEGEKRGSFGGSLCEGGRRGTGEVNEGDAGGDLAPVIATVNVSTVVTTPAGLVYLPVNVMFLPGTASMYSCGRDEGDSM